MVLKYLNITDDQNGNTRQCCDVRNAEGWTWMDKRNWQKGSNNEKKEKAISLKQFDAAGASPNYASDFSGDACEGQDQVFMYTCCSLLDIAIHKGKPG